MKGSYCEAGTTANNQELSTYSEVLHSERRNMPDPIQQKLDHFLSTKKVPNIIFHGSSGSGKRTIVNRFLYKIYGGNRPVMKMNVMTVECSHGKGIKFIREELKFFAKTNIYGVMFKSIVLLNADSLTIDAQSALRRCIELFSHTTRFFIVVENKERLLNPILSRFCEIHVPEPHVGGQFVNRHRERVDTQYRVISDSDSDSDSNNKANKAGTLASLLPSESPPIPRLIEASLAIYEAGFSAMDVVSLSATPSERPSDRSLVTMCFYKIKPDFRCEKMLIFYALYFMYVCSNEDLKNMLLM